jgi:small subunit ribosomal protein S27Ae
VIILPDEGAPVSKEKKVKSREKKQRTGRKHESLKIWEYYEVKDGSLTRKREHCPRCGPGSFLSRHDKRFYCGRCGFTQLEKGEGPPRPREAKEEQPQEEAEAPQEKGEGPEEESPEKGPSEEKQEGEEKKEETPKEEEPEEPEKSEKESEKA